MSNDLLEFFREAYRNLELLPLLDQKELEKFRVDYASNVIAPTVRKYGFRRQTFMHYNRLSEYEE